MSQAAKDLDTFINAMLDDFDSEFEVHAFGYTMHKLVLDKDGAVMERILPMMITTDSSQANLVIKDLSIADKFLATSV